jgi:hypothetical protein
MMMSKFRIGFKITSVEFGVSLDVEEFFLVGLCEEFTNSTL